MKDQKFSVGTYSGDGINHEMDMNEGYDVVTVLMHHKFIVVGLQNVKQPHRTWSKSGKIWNIYIGVSLCFWLLISQALKFTPTF